MRLFAESREDNIATKELKDIRDIYELYVHHQSQHNFKWNQVQVEVKVKLTWKEKTGDRLMILTQSLSPLAAISRIAGGPTK